MASRRILRIYFILFETSLLFSMYPASQDANVEIVKPVEPYLIKAAGESLTLKCVGKIDHTLQWRHNGTVLQHGLKVIITNALTQDRKQRLSIITRLSIREHDAGLYECRSEHDALSRDAVDVYVTREPTPNATVKIAQPPTPHHTLPKGQPFQIRCETQRGILIDWYKDGVRIEDGDAAFTINTHSRDSMNLWSSYLKSNGPPKEEDAVYKCQNRENPRDFDVIEMHMERTSSSNTGSDMRDFPPVPRNFESVVLRLATTLELICRIESSGTFSSHWHKGHTVIHSNDKFSIRRGHGLSILTISSTVHNDTGIYRCSFTDEETGLPAGEIVYNASLIPCPAMAPTRHFRPVDCDATSYVGQQCRVECLSHGAYNAMTHPVTCQFDPIRNEGQWTDANALCMRKSMKPHRDLSVIPSSMSDVLLRANDDLDLQCGHTHVTWVKSEEHVPIHNNNKYQMMGGLLTIRNAKKEDADLYTCIVKRRNGGTLGHKKYNVTVMHCDKPEIPKYGNMTGCSHEPVYGEICHFHCPEGSKISGSQSRSCELNDQQTEAVWTGVRTVCEGAAHLEGVQEDLQDSYTASANIPQITPSLFVIIWTLLTLINR